MTQICFAYSFIIWVLISAFPELFIRIFNQDAELITAAVPSLHIYFFGFFMMAFQFTGQCVFKALNKAPQAVFFSILRKAIIVAPLTVILPRIGGLGVAGCVYGRTDFKLYRRSGLLYYHAVYGASETITAGL